LTSKGQKLKCETLADLFIHCFACTSWCPTLASRTLRTLLCYRHMCDSIYHLDALAACRSYILWYRYCKVTIYKAKKYHNRKLEAEQE